MKKKVLSIIAKQLKLKPNKIEESASLKYDLGADSLDIMAIIASIEDSLDIEIDLEEVSNLDTIKDIEDYIEAKVK